MKLKLIQTNKELFAAEFIVRKGTIELGKISLNGHRGSMEAKIQGQFCDGTFEMCHGKSKSIRSKAFRPYVIQKDGMEFGVVYQTTHKQGFFKHYEFHQMVIGDREINLYMIDFGDEGSKNPVYSGAEQIALIEKDCVVYNDLHIFDIYAKDETAAFISVLFGMYMYVNGAYKPGVKVTESIEKFIETTKNSELLEKFDPLFKDNISE